MYLDFSDHISSDISESIPKQGREDIYGVKYIPNVKFSLLSNSGQGSIMLIKLFGT